MDAGNLTDGMAPLRRATPRQGFTLIELLIVVAIIAILAAIAVPNFMEAQTRARASRARGDLREVGVALELYRLDHRAYPSSKFLYYRDRLRPLTTPVACLPALPLDPFNPGRDALSVKGSSVYAYGERKSGYDLTCYALSGGREPLGVQWVAFSYGPQRNATNYPTYAAHRGPWGFDVRGYVDTLYDPSNGSLSAGIIQRLGP